MTTEPPSAAAVWPPSSASLRARVSAAPKGRIPPGIEQLTVGVDPGKHFCFWAAVAWRRAAPNLILDYGIFEVLPVAASPEDDLLTALYVFEKETLLSGWKSSDSGAPGRAPDLTLLDAGWQPDALRRFCNARRNDRLLPAHAVNRRIHSAPGNYWARIESPAAGPRIVYDALAAEKELHRRLLAPPNDAGSLLLFHPADERQHYAITKHLTAPPGGPNDHLHAALLLACLAGRMLAVSAAPAQGEANDE